MIPAWPAGRSGRPFRTSHRLDAKPVQVLLTHAHLDHVMMRLDEGHLGLVPTSSGRPDLRAGAAGC